MGGQGSGRRKAGPAFLADADGELWERQPRESDPAWRGFVTYRDMGLGRTIVASALQLGKKRGYKSTLEGWSVRCGWRERVEAYDSWRDQQRQIAEIEEERGVIKDMVKRHLETSSMMQRLVQVEFARHVTALQAHIDNPDTHKAPTLTVDQIRQLADYSIKLERLNRGEPGTLEEVTVTASNDDKRKAMRKLLGSPEAMAHVDELLAAMGKGE